MGRSVLGGIFSTDDWCGRAQPTVGSATPGKVVPACIRKQAEQALESKPVHNMSSWLLLQFLPPGSCLEFPLWWTMIEMCKPKTSAFLPQASFGCDILSQQQKQDYNKKNWHWPYRSAEVSDHWMPSYMGNSVAILKPMVASLPSKIRSKSKARCLLFVMTLIVQRLSVEKLDMASVKWFTENWDWKFKKEEQIIPKVIGLNLPSR